MRATLTVALLCCAIAPAMAQSFSERRLVVAGSEVAALRVEIDGTVSPSPRQSLGADCNELLPVGPSLLVAAHGRGLTVVSIPSAANQAPLLRPLVAGREIDAVEMLTDGHLLALEHPREVQGEAVDPHAVLQLKLDGGELDTLGLLSPAAYDFHHDARAARVWVSHLSGRTIESLVARDGAWTVAPPLRLDATTVRPRAEAAARSGSEPKDDAFWLDRLLFPAPDGGTMVLAQGREVTPRLIALGAEPPGELHVWSAAFLARNGAITADGTRLWLNAGRQLFGLVRESAIEVAPPRYREVEHSVDGTVVALGFSADGTALALLIAESREATRIEVWAPDLSRRQASQRLRGSFTQLAFIE